jgi:hypothetical protein
MAFRPDQWLLLLLPPLPHRLTVQITPKYSREFSFTFTDSTHQMTAKKNVKKNAPIKQGGIKQGGTVGPGRFMAAKKPAAKKSAKKSSAKKWKIMSDKKEQNPLPPGGTTGPGGPKERAYQL